MRKKRPLTSRGVQRQSERERSAGIDPDDEAAQWLTEHDPPPAPAQPTSARKSKTLHRWRAQQDKRARP